MCFERLLSKIVGVLLFLGQKRTPEIFDRVARNALQEAKKRQILDRGGVFMGVLLIMKKEDSRQNARIKGGHAHNICVCCKLYTMILG